MDYYKHTQMTGWAIIGPVGAAIIATFYFWFAQGYLVSLIIGLLLLIVLFLFISLNVVVDDQSIRLWFGLGLIRKRIPLSEVKSAQPVRNKWYYGWGIRLIPGGLMYNVAGLDAVELVLANGRKFRIGTDEPQQLNAVIQQRLR
jgi:hypothetical protein